MKRPIFTLKLKDNQGKEFSKSFTLYPYDYNEFQNYMAMIHTILSGLTEVHARADGKFQMGNMIECSITDCTENEFLLF